MYLIMFYILQNVLQNAPYLCKKDGIVLRCPRVSAFKDLVC